MKRLITFTLSVLFTAVFAGATFGQTPTGKIGWIMTAAFNAETGGITRYINAEKALDTEMKPRATELQTLQTRMATLSEDIRKMTSNPAVPVNQQAVAAKQEEGQKLKREFDFKQQEAQAVYTKRRQELLAPIQTQIYQALREYAKTKGYSVVIDVSAMDTENAPNPVLVLDETADITKDFIAFYNAKPATTATTATPTR